MGDDHDVLAGKGDEGFVQAEPFPETPFDAVSLYGSPKALLNHKPQSMVGQSVHGDVDAKVASSQSLAASLDLLILGRGAQPLVKLEAESTTRHDLLSRGNWTGPGLFSSRSSCEGGTPGSGAGAGGSRSKPCPGRIARSGRKALSPFCTPSPEHVPSGFRGRSFQESVLSIPFQVAGLKCSFRHIHSSKVSQY